MKLTIIGASGHGKVVADIAKLNGYDEIEFLDDNEIITHCGEYPVVGKTDKASETDGEMFVGIGNTEIRKEFMERLKGKTFVTLIHPNAVVADGVKIGAGSAVMAGAVINPGAVIGEGCIVNTASSIDHDCSIGDYVHIAVGSHLCGTVTVGSGTWIGAGATVSNDVGICGDCIIGAGSVAVNNIDEPGIYIGVPARKKVQTKDDKAKDLIIIGAGGFGREVAWLTERINAVSPTWNILGFMDDNDSVQGTEINGYKVVGKTSDAPKFSDAYFVCAVGSSAVREKIINGLKSANPDVRFATLIDPGVEMSGFVDIGEGSVICAHTIITVNVTIGNHVIINPDCTVGHDAVLNDFVTLYPSVNVSGNTNIGHGVELGTGMQIIQGINIGERSIVGAGSVAVKDLPAKCTAVGCPAKPIKFFE